MALLSRSLAVALFFSTLPLPGATGDYQRQADGITLQTSAGFLKVQIVSDNIVRVTYSPAGPLLTRAASAVLPHATPAKFSLAATDRELTLATATIKARVDRPSGRVTFLDSTGKPVVREAEGGRTVEPAEVQGERTLHVRQLWDATSGESLYGLGQQQLGAVDIKGYDLDLWQHNTRVVVPMLLSSHGYGIFWDNMSFTRFGDLRPFVPIPAEKPAPDIRPGGGRPQDVHWESAVTAPATGDYQIRSTSNGAIKVWLDNRLIIDHYRQNWLADEDQVKVHLEANHRYPIKLDWSVQSGNIVQLAWKTPSPEAEKTALWSEVASGVDYYFIYGPKLDTVVAGYRTLTGQAPMMPEWAFGLWQSRQKYNLAQESLDVVKGFRSRQIPFDNIVQDWQYWKADSWGSHEFDPARFPDPAGWIKAIHDLHAHLMISVWGKFYPGTKNFDAMQKAGYLYQPTLQEGIKDWINFPYTFYDAFNAGARKLFWSQIDTNLFRKGVDAWWMDATEPDLMPSPPTLEGSRTHMPKTGMGTGSSVINGYSLFNSEAVYDGQRSVAPNQRVFILTRSGYAGQQRYAAATWSGDITSTWTAMAKQIAAGLGLSISGIPYWTQDIGGYTMQAKFSARNPKPEDEEEWRELNARWFEFGTFTPLLRVHGELKPREMWTMGGESHPAYQAELKFDRLRYRMLPYIYSLAGAVTQQAGTIMRPLAMDFPADQTACQLNDEYMFGPAFLVAPVTAYQARTKTVYLPPGSTWYDFWTGKASAAAGRVDAPAPYDAIPAFVRAGSIVPFGPEEQYTGEKPAETLTVYVYAGANGEFSLYEDQGATFDYERGAFSRIPLRWDEARGTLSVGKRQGTFPEMLKQRTMQLVLVSPGSPVGFSFNATSGKTVKYAGDAISVKLK